MINVIKRNGTKEPLNIDKIHKVLGWAIEGLDNVSLSDIELNAKLSINDGTTTQQIHDILIRSANDLISEEFPNYQYVAARLLLYSLRKGIWCHSEPPRLYEHIVKCVNQGVYDNYILEQYTESEIHKISKIIKHKRDELFTYSGLQQLVDKYLVKNRKTGVIYETPQFAYIMIAMTLFSKYPKETRVEYIKKCYNYISTFKINLPTPIMCGVRTPIRAYSSCILVDIGDSMKSIFSSVSAVGYYTANRAGLGCNVGRIRPIGSEVRAGEVIHTGVIPFLKVIEATTKSCTQNGVRGGSATISINFFHPEIEDVIVLKNNGGTDDSRVRNLDYCIQFSKLFYQRLIKNENITLFSSHECKDLYDSFGTDKFDALYIKYEKDKTLRFRKQIPARQLAELFSRERLETGRIYLMNIDNANDGPYLETVNMTNLCVSKDTKILTDKGYKVIAGIAGETVNIWNGVSWSETTVLKTGSNQKLYRVSLSDGRYVDCTDYHKWYTTKNYYDSRFDKYTEKRTNTLVKGDKLIKFDFPIIDGVDKWTSPYTQGFMCADGAYFNTGTPKIALYGEKKKIVPYLDIHSSSYEETELGTLNIIPNKNIKAKFEVPLNCSINDKLEWLAGYMDGDGCLVVTDGNPALQATSNNPSFLRDVQMMLDTLGVSSKITHASDEGMRLLPDGNGGKKEYFVRKTERLLITSNGIKTLMSLGFKTNRIKLFKYNPQSDARQFVKVVSVEELDGVHDTYCVKEEKRGMAVFNGVLTGNCVEILQPTTPISHIDDEDGEIGVCILSAINVLETSLSEFESVCDIIVRLLDEIIDLQDYPVKAAENFAKNRRSLGIGITNFAALLAKKKISYENKEACEVIDEIGEYLQYYTLKASSELAKEKGRCNKYDKTAYSVGLHQLPLQNSEVDKFLQRKPVLDWVALYKHIEEFGLRNSTTTAQMPVESSSVIQNSTNSIDPVRALLSYKKSKCGLLKQLVPNFEKYGQYYTLAFDMKSNDGYNAIVGTYQRWIDMGISANNYYNYEHYEGGKIPLSILIKDMINMYKLGFRTLYYTNTPDGDSESGCTGGACTL